MNCGISTCKYWPAAEKVTETHLACISQKPTASNWQLAVGKSAGWLKKALETLIHGNWHMLMSFEVATGDDSV